MMRKKLVAFEIKSLNNHIKRLLDRTAIAGNEANLTGGQYAIIGYLNESSEEKNIYQRDIESEFNIRRSTASELIGVLEREGYVYKEGVSSDGRLKKIVLTEKGRRMDEKAKRHINQLEIKLTNGITKEEMTSFYSVLYKVKENAKIK